jgi:hypothetical protein
MGSLEAIVARRSPLPLDRTIHVLAVLEDGRLETWAPFAAGAAAALFDSPIAGAGGAPGGAPTVYLHRLLVPGKHADVLQTSFDPLLRVVASAAIAHGLVVPQSIPPLALNDLVVRLNTAAPPLPMSHVITEVGPTKDGEALYALDLAFAAGSTDLFAYRSVDALLGSIAGATLTLDAGDKQTAAGSWLLMSGKFFRVDAVDTSVDPWDATISSPAGDPLPAVGTYVRPITTSGRLAPFMRLNPATNGNWDAAVLDRVKLLFPVEPEKIQQAKAFSVGPGNKPLYVVLQTEFTPVNPAQSEFVLDAAIGEWHREVGDTARNPDLSWEYWNGKGWWHLDVLDQTLNFKQTGVVRFRVPPDLVSSDWSGKTNHWIRARLIGGDYGQEKVTVLTTDLGGGKTQQTVERSSEGIRAPSVLKLHISYALCGGIVPLFLLTEDSGSLRDQSDANRTPGAIVEGFIPLAMTLARLSTPAPPAGAPDECPPDCNCGGRQNVTSPSRQSATAPVAATPVPATVGGRAILIGFDATLSGAPVNVLLLVDQQPFSAFAPLAVEALAADRFQPIVADDATRGLGESGVLSMAFAAPPAKKELFGRTLSWIRLRPAGSGADAATWTPALRGAYLNAVWASATETLTRELLGSSEGAPQLTLTLARPPILHRTLELRVREPLGEEERQALQAEVRHDDRRPPVLSDVDGLPGDWVLWRQAIDPGDERPDARVYSLDEATGTIQFGDGRHGMIPPIGRDSIVAFSYQRTESGAPGTDIVPANAIAARTPLNLVTPVESVEAVVAADHAAGGAPPEPAERVLRFGFARVRHRSRAVTARDIEDLALESSPDIVQARCFVRRGSVRLVLVMKGRDPKPSAAQVRELRRLLLTAAPVALAAPDALQINGPRVRRLRIDLRLRIETLDKAGALAEAIKRRLAAFFDTSSGGVEKEGWPLGLNPGEEDVALALVDAPFLEGISSVALHENLGAPTDARWPASIKSSDLVMLDDDPVRIQFETAEVLV